MTRVLVTGGRDFTDATTMDSVLGAYGITELAQGGASGADALAKAWAQRNRVPVREFPADWTGPCTNQCQAGHRRPRGNTTYCPAAGLHRNQDMLDEFAPDLVIAFPGGNGTRDMVKRATRQLGGEHVIIVIAPVREPAR